MGELTEIRSTQMDVRDALDQAADALEVITNCNYLMCEDALNPEAVREYANDSQSAVRKLGQSLRALASVPHRLKSAA
jgi:hypothetical protein